MIAKLREALEFCGLLHEARRGRRAAPEMFPLLCKSPIWCFHQIFLTSRLLQPRVKKSTDLRSTMTNELSRRAFLSRAGAGLSAAWVSANWPALLAAADHARHAPQSATPPKSAFFSPAHALELE